MRTTFMILTLTAAVTGVCAATEIRRFGEPLCDYVEVTPIETIVSDPEVWAGREVRIAGRVSGVCTRKGCSGPYCLPAGVGGVGHRSGTSSRSEGLADGDLHSAGLSHRRVGLSS